MKILKQILKANGKKGVAQGSALSPLLSNIYLSRIDHMFETAVRETARRGYQQIEYCRFADDMVILINGHPALAWLVDKTLKRLRQELGRLRVAINKEKTRIVNLEEGETFNFLGFEYRRVKHKNGIMVLIRPRKKKVQELIEKVRNHISRNRFKAVIDMVRGLNLILRGWTNYFRIGHSSKVFNFIRQWVEKKVRRFVRKSQGRKGFGWKEWDSKVIYEGWGLYNDYRIRYYQT